MNQRANISLILSEPDWVERISGERWVPIPQGMDIDDAEDWFHEHIRPGMHVIDTEGRRLLIGDVVLAGGEITTAGMYSGRRINAVAYTTNGIDPKKNRG